MAPVDEEEESLGFIYDVFLSFRDEDATIHTFIEHLCKEFRRKGIYTYFDDKHVSVSNPIEESKILIIVFSENYASSTRCLDELVKILECTKRNTKQVVFPIFYHVNPSDIRHQRNSYGKHMMAHEDEFGKDSQIVKEWKSALNTACNFPGEEKIDNGIGYEINFIEKIVMRVHKNVTPKPLHTDLNLVGLKPHVEHVKSLLDMKSDDGMVRMLGIWGLGGVGKTELAKSLYNNIVRHFDAASFLADVREKSNEINGLKDLQKTLLLDMLKELGNELDNTYKGMSRIKSGLHTKKVLLVLDDADDKDQLKKLAGGCDWFGSGSRIIITTRDKDVLLSHQVENIYEMKELDEQHSLELFCWNAFKQSQPKIGLEDVSLRLVDLAKCLPFALKVIGSELAPLHENGLDAWECALEEYKRRPPNEKIQDMLKISYDRLEDNAKQVFLDIACFFKGEKIEYVEKILREFGTASNINTLVNRSLLTIEDGFLKMHDLIQDMGREIVRQEAPNYPGERSRLWAYDDVIEILTEDSGSHKIQGIMLDSPQREEVCWSGNAFKKMKWLRILIVRNTSFLSKPEYLPNHLRVLDWEEYPSKSFPSRFHPKKIIVFNWPRSHLIVEESFKKFSCLTEMDFSNNQLITQMPDVSEVENLKKLRLDHCRNLTVVHESVGLLKRLTHLSVSQCTKLRNFLQSMFLPSLEVLDLNLCVSLAHFPEIEQEMGKKLKVFMINTAIQELPESIGNLSGLISMDLSCSRKLKHLPSSLFLLPNFVSFKIEGCSQLRESFRSFIHNLLEVNVHPILRTLYFRNGNLSDEDLLAILCYFPKLEDSIASENNFVSLPTYIKECVDLTSLDVSYCTRLQKIPKCTNLKILNVDGCTNLEEIAELPSIQKVDARYCSNLSKETSDMLWSQVQKERHGIEVVMPLKTEFPECFRCAEKNGGNPRFWARGKFPNVALAMAFRFQDESEMEKPAPHQLVDLQLLINDRYVPRKGYHNLRVEAEHVLIFDLRVLFSDKEWLGLNELLLQDWNLVQVSYEATSSLMTVSRWGVFFYEEGTNMEDIQFTCPDPKYLDERPLSMVLKKDPKKEDTLMIENLGLDVLFEKMLMETMGYEEGKDFATEEMNILMGGLKELSTQAKEALESKGSSSALEDPSSYLRWVLDATANVNAEPKFSINKDLALIRVKDPVKIAMAMGVGNSRSVALQKGMKISWSPHGNVLLPRVEMRTHMTRILSVLIAATPNTVASWKGIKTSFMVPGFHDPILEAFMILMKQEGRFESEAKSKLLWKLREEHEALRNRIAEVEKESNVPVEDSGMSRFWRSDEYDGLVKKLKGEYEKFVSQSLKSGVESGIESGSSNREMQMERGCKCVRKYAKVGGILKGRGEELEKQYDDGIKGLQKSEEILDVMSAIYLNGVKDGVLEAEAILLALKMDMKDEEGTTDEIGNGNPGVEGVSSPNILHGKKRDRKGKEKIWKD